jgi:hypothetical protein
MSGTRRKGTIALILSFREEAGNLPMPGKPGGNLTICSKKSEEKDKYA